MSIQKNKLRNKIVTQDIKHTFSKTKCLHKLFEAQAALSPEAVAVCYENQSLTYAELDAKSNQLAHHLIDLGVEKESLVVICLERSLEMIIGILGVLKAGAAYVPIDPAYPDSRKEFIIKDTKSNIILTQHHLKGNFSQSGTSVVCLDTYADKLADKKTCSPIVDITAENLVYVIYTSGSTGQPKGVQIEHQSVTNLIKGQIKYVQHPVKRFLFTYSFAFDGSVLLIWWTLLQGATLVIAEKDTEKDVQKLANTIQEEEISHLLTFPSLYSLLLEQNDAKKLKSLESVSLAGEIFPAKLARKHQNILPHTTLLNQYGPTEATVGATIYRVPPNFAATKVPIGQSIEDVCIYVLNQDLQKTKIGEQGEIYIGGNGLARGYLNRAKLSQEKFISNPFSSKKSDRLYKTGDLGRILPDGNLDFLGRADYQIKLRGYRIELAEIETTLAHHPLVRDVVVDVQGNTEADKKLIAYFTLNGEEKLSIQQIRRFLLQKLPEYMVPAVFKELKEMPIATSGKIDRKALPTISTERPDLEQELKSSENHVQDWLTQLWKEVLDIEEIGIEDKFFELGGNSLQAGSFIGKVQDTLKETVFVVSLFESPTIKEYAEFLEKNYPEGLRHIPLTPKCNTNLIKSPTLLQPSYLNQLLGDKKKDKKNLQDQDFSHFKSLIPHYLAPSTTVEKKNPPAIFLLSPPRSGSTLLRVMLAGHPDLFAANELQLLHFENLKQWQQAYSGKFSLWSEGTIKAVAELKNCSAQQAKAVINTYAEQGFTSKDFYRELQILAKDRIILDKSPSYATDIAVLRKAENDFENAIFIHLTRHPYSMVRSFAKMHMDQVMFLQSNEYDAEQIGELIWQESHQNIATFLEGIPAHRQASLLYEDLVSNPEQAIRQVCAQIGLSFHPDMLRPYDNAEKKMMDGLYADSKAMGDPNFVKYGKIIANKAEEWKKVATDNFLHQQTWKLAEKLGYNQGPFKIPKVQTINNIVERDNEPSENGTFNDNTLNEAKQSQDLDTTTNLQFQKNKNTENAQTDIAIIGMSGRFPGAENIQTFWQNLVEEKDVSVSFTEEELRADGVNDELLKNPNYVKRGMPLQDADKFDASFFGYLPKEAALIDPQHRIFLECAYAALEDAGYSSENHQGNIGVFGSVAKNTYLHNNILSHPNYYNSIENFTQGITQEKDFTATRVAYNLNLKGPALSIQTACSGSGVAVHLACQSLLTGDNDAVIVGGGRIQPPLASGHLHTDGHALSPDGYCRPFDASADGMVRGNGMAFLVLKKLDKAIADGDCVHAVIKGTAIGNDGSEKIGFTAPSVQGQTKTIVAAYQRAGIDPETVSYIEAHGTGTYIGDPIEVAGLTQAFAQFTDRKGFCAIGSVKSNIGHLDAGACIAGIIKTVLALKNECIPKTLHYRKANPQINFSATPFYVNDRLNEWKKGNSPRRAGISSFGLGGTNAHIIIEEAPTPIVSQTTTPSSQLILVSGKNKSALQRNALRIANYLQQKSQQSESKGQLQNIAYTLQAGRNHYAHRLFVIAENTAHAATKLQAFDGQNLNSKVVEKQVKKVAFLFPGGGAQYSNMGLGLYHAEPVFRQEIDRCLHILLEKHELDLRTVLYPDFKNKGATKTPSEPIVNPLHGTVLLFITEYATAVLWQSYGILPEEVIGHSLGEYLAACIAGVFTLEEALSMVVKRGKLFASLPKGAMLSIPLSPQTIKPYLNENLSFAAINKPNQCTISGSIAAIKALKEVLNKEEIHSTFLHIDVAAHSVEVEPIMDEFADFLKNIDYRLPQISVISNLTGKTVRPDYIASPQYWVNHLRGTVLFAEGIEILLKKKNRVLLEVGPGQTLSTLTRQHPSRQASTLILASLRHPQEVTADSSFFQKTVGQLWLEGVSFDWNKAATGKNLRRVSLPTYAFEKQTHWIKPKANNSSLMSPAKDFANTHQINMKPTSPTNTNVPPLGKTYIKNSTTQVKEDLRKIFKDLSGLSIAASDEQFTFLELGFDSLLLTQAVGKIKQKFKVELSFRRLFEDAPCFADLTTLVEGLLPESYKIEYQGESVEDTVLQNQSTANLQNNPSVLTHGQTKTDFVLQDLKQIFTDLSGLTLQQSDEQFSFLELGFDSLLLTQAVGKIQQKFNVKLSFRSLLESAPDLPALTDFIAAQIDDTYYSDKISPLPTQQIPQSQPIYEKAALPNFPSNQTVNNESVERIIQQQLHLMEQQLLLLQNNGSSPQKLANKKHNPPAVEAKKGQTVLKNSSPSQQVSKGAKHNHWKPIDKARRKNGKAIISERQKKYLKQLIERYTTKTKGSQMLTQAQRTHLADPRSVSGFNKLWKDMVYQIAAVRSKGSKIWDVDGNEYIDYRNSFGIALFGHTPDFIQKAVQEQLEKGIELGVLTPLAMKTAQLLCELSGSERVTFVNTGSESLSAAVRAARTVTMKDKIAYFTGDYHGIADEMLARNVQSNGQNISRPVAPGIPQFLVENVIVLDYNDPEVLDKITTHAHELAAVLIEPIQPNNPIHQPHDLLKAIRKLTTEQDIALIFDEMITGFRVGLRGAQGWYDIEADIVCYGKIISGGLPMAAVAGKAKYLDVFDGGMWQFGDDSVPEVGVTFFGGTFVRHPLSLATAYAALSEIKRQGQPMYDALNAKTARFAERIRDLFVAAKVPMKVLSTASIIAFKPTDNNPFTKLFFYYLQLNGIHIAEKAALLSVAHTQEDLDFTYSMIEDTIRSMQTADFFPITLREVADESQIIYPPLSNSLSLSEQMLEKKNIPLTEGQKEIWIEQQINDAAAAAYNLSSDFVLSGKLNVEALEIALDQLVQRHEALRTVFNKDTATQQVFPELELKLIFHDFSKLPESQKKESLKKLKSEEVEIPLDLFGGPLCRFVLVCINEVKYHLLMTVHHGIADGWSCGILAHDLAALYTAVCQGRKADLPVAKQISAYAIEQAKHLQTESAKETENYWINEFKGEIPVLDLPTDWARPRIKTYACDLEKISLGEDLYRDLKQTAAANGTTFFFLMYTAFHTYLHRLTGQEDLVLGLVAAGQTISENQNLVTHGVNLLPVRVSAEKNTPFSQHLKNVRGKILDAFEYQNYTLGSLVKKLELVRDASRQPLISVLFNMDAEGKALQFADLEVVVQPIPRHYETFDMFINVKPIGDNCEFELIYNTDLFAQQTIKNRLAEFRTLLQSIVSSPSELIGKLGILPDTEKHILLNEWNDTFADFPDNVSLHHLIEQQTERTPDSIAVEYKNKKLSYRQLNNSVNNLAHYLLTQQVKKGDFVGVFTERSADLIIELLAVMKVGGIYVPLDPSNPQDRLKTIIEDAQAGVIISDSKMLNRLPHTDARIILYDQIQPELEQQSSKNPICDVLANDLVYVIYTSGSTGKPKGVVIPHYAVIDHHFAMAERIGISNKDTFFSVATVSFDPSVMDFFLPLMLGAKVIIAEQEAVTDAFLLKKRLEDCQPTLMQATPATWRMLLTTAWQAKPNLKILTGGEGLSEDLASALLSRSEAVWNIYGPTETTIWSTAKKVSAQHPYHTDYEAVGRPLNNVKIYILDEYLQPVPIGFAGEVYVGGVGVAPGGYFKRDELSQEKFIPFPEHLRSDHVKNHPLHSSNLYRTGDIARYLPTGDLEYLRRSDGQVKIRGFRIELGEIESAVSQLSSIAQAVVIVREDQKNNKTLAAYVILNKGYLLDTVSLKKQLSIRLPEYMIPTSFTEMQSFPLTATLKINRSQLPTPDFSVVNTAVEYLAPSTPLEMEITEIWCEVLNLTRIGVHDSFFDLGGHSLLAVSLMSRIEKKIGKRLPLSVLLENATIHSLSNLLEDEKKTKQTWNSLVPVRSTGTKEPIYIVHGAGLHVMLFRTLAEHIGDDRPVYALQAQGLSGEAEPLERIEAIAAHYVSQLLEHNPTGPYALGGYSFGGIIAFEMAKQLQAQGKTVAFLGLFDTLLHHSLLVESNKKSIVKKLVRSFKKCSWEMLNFLKSPVKNYHYRLFSVKRHFNRLQYNLGLQSKKEDTFASKVDKANYTAFSNYKISPYSGTIHLFRAKEKRFYLDDFEYLGWQPYANEVIIQEVEGDHINLFDNENGKKFAIKLREYLDKL